MDFDRHGPGVLGYYLDTIAFMASLCPLYPEVFTGKGSADGWERSDDPVLQVIIAGWRGQLQDQSDLMFTYVRARESIGRCWLIADQQTGYNVTLSGNADQEMFTWTDLWGRQRRTPLRGRVFMSWFPDPYEQWKPYSPVCRALSDLRRLRAAVRSQTRTINGRLVLNGMMAFDPGDETGKGARPFKPDPDGEDDLEPMDQIVDDYLRHGKESYRNDDSPAATLPYPYIGKPAQYVEIGRDLDPLILEVEDKATAAIARAVNFPEQLLTQGPGAANHWNEFLLQESQVKQGLAPKLNPLVKELTRWYFQDRVRAMNEHLEGWGYDARKVRVQWDMQFLLKRPSMFADLMAAWQAGVISREDVARELGIPVMPLPDGLSEFEFWELSTGSKGAPYVEVDEDGQVIVPDTGGGAAPDAIEATASEPPALPAGPSGLPPGFGSPTGTPGTPNGDTNIQEPPMPAVTAAVTLDDLGYDPNAVYDDASKHDLRTEAALTALTAAMTTAVTAELTRRLVTTFPRGSVEREAARSKSFEMLWAEADAAQRQQVGVDGVIADVVAEYQPQVEQVIADAHEGFWAKWGPLIGTVAALLAANAAAHHSAAMADWLTTRVAKGSFKGIKTPLNIVRSTMMVAGGAQTAVGGALVRNAANQPRPSTGGEWKGNTGHLTGHNTVTLLPGKFTMQWDHGYFGEPEVPFPPHVALHGREFTKYSEIAPYMPNDHGGCKCLVLLRWVVD